MGIAILAPSYNLVHGYALEAIRRQAVRSLPCPTTSHPFQKSVHVFDQTFWTNPEPTARFLTRLCRDNITAIIIIIRYCDRPMLMRAQLDPIIETMYPTVQARLPVMPVCVLFHGNEPVGHREKARLKSMFKTYFTHQAAVPRELFSEHLLIIRHTYSKCLRDDKIASVIDWITERNHGRKVWDHFQLVERVATPTHPENSSRDSFTSRHRGRRSHSEPKVIPTASPEFLNASCRAARKPVNLNLDNLFLKAALRQVADGERHWEMDCWNYEKADHIHATFLQLARHRERIYRDLKTRIRALKAERAWKPTRQEYFLTHFSWVGQVWSRKVTHVVIQCDIGGIGTEQIMRLPQPLHFEELRVVRAFILEFYSSKRIDSSKKVDCGDGSDGRRMSWNLHRSASVHEARGGVLECCPALVIRASGVFPFRLNHSLQTVYSQDVGGLRMAEESASLFPRQATSTH